MNKFTESEWKSIRVNTLNGFTRKYLKFQGKQCLYLWDNWQIMGIGLHKCFELHLMP